jgi:hypothetical protein
MTFDKELKTWNAHSERDFYDWDLRMVENLRVNGWYLVTVSRGKEKRCVYVNASLGKVMNAKFIQSLEAEWIATVQREARRDHLGH